MGLNVGYRGSGTLAIESGGKVFSDYCYLGYWAGSTGSVTVAGTGSLLAAGATLVVGNAGTGTLMVSEGGRVSAGTLYASLSDLLGDGTIKAGGAVIDADLVFTGPQAVLPFGTGGTLSLNLVGSGSLGAGYKGAGTLRISDGATVASTSGFLGHQAGSTGSATITGADSTWANGRKLYVGYSGSGTLTIEAGAHVSSAPGGTGGVGSGYLAYFSGSSGTVTVTGAGSNWANSGDLYVGHYGSGVLTIEAGAQVSNLTGRIGYSYTSTGTVTVTGAGSTWTNAGDLYVLDYGGDSSLTVSDGGMVSTRTLYASPGNLLGDGTIHAKGAVLDGDLVITGSQVTVSFGTGGVLNLDLDGSGALGAGLRGTGTLRIADGVTAMSASGMLGRGSGSAGTATVTGAGSVWTNAGDLYVGDIGNGALIVQEGGQVSNAAGYIGYNSSIGTVTVTGAGSKWANSGGIYVGYTGKCTLTVADGGQVTARNLSVSYWSSLRLVVSGDDMIVLGDAATVGRLFTNHYSKVNVYADAFLAPGVYAPISEYAGRAMTWSGFGSYDAYGGTWENAAKTFIVAPAAPLATGSAAPVAANERFVFTDWASGSRVGVSFGAIPDGVTLSGAPMSADDRHALSLSPGFEGAALSAWEFTSNLDEGEEVLLSFDIGAGAADLRLWQFSDGIWSAYVPDLLTYDANGIASFSVTAFSGYAVVAVPEAATLCLLLIGGLVMVQQAAARRRPAPPA